MKARAARVAFGVAALLAAGAAAGATAGTATYSDPAGDARGDAPDLTKVTVRAVPGRSVTWTVFARTSDPNESVLQVHVDADASCRTGQSCADWLLELNGPISRMLVSRWEASRGEWSIVESTSIPFDTGGWPAAIAWSPPSALWKAPGRFSLRARDASQNGRDQAPATGFWALPLPPGTQLAPTRVTQTWTVSDGVRRRPPTAGETFTYAASFAYRAGGKPLVVGSPQCLATAERAGSRPVALRPRSVASATVDGVHAFICKLDAIASRLRGSTLRVRLTVRDASGHKSAESTLVARIR